MSRLLALLGIDVSMKSLVACILVGDKTYRSSFENGAEGHAELLAWASSKAEGLGIRAAVEATGSHHKELVRYLDENGQGCLVLNPRQARDLAKGLGISSKTDKVDAQVIAQVLEVSKVRYQVPRTKLHDDLRDISRQVQDLTALLARTKNRLKTPARYKGAIDSDERLIRFFSAEIRKLEAKWLALVNKSETLKAKFEHQLTIPGIGPKTARIVVSELPENLEGFKSKQVACYAGVSPCTKESGSLKDAAHIHGGNPNLRNAFFMPSLRASSMIPEFKDFYARLRSKGRTHRQAATAVMHKLIRRSAAVHIRHQPWLPILDKS
jgi:Transposase and inactivated derivatives